jgi:competence protein ComEC
MRFTAVAGGVGGAQGRRTEAPLRAWYGGPGCLLLGMAAGLLSPSLSPLARCQAWLAMGVGVLALLAWTGHRLPKVLAHGWLVGGRPLLCGMALAWCAFAMVGWRAQGRAAAMWPADLGPRLARAQVQVDSLPQPLPTGGWQLEAQVLRWQGEQAPAWKAGRLVAITEGELPRLAPVLRVRVYWPVGPMPSPGGVWWVKANWHRPDGVANPGGPDAVLMAWERGIGAVGRVGNRPADLRPDQSTSAWRLDGLLDRWRAALRARITQQVNEPALAGVLAGLTVGDQSAVTRDDWDVFRRTGVAHLVSISGSHIAVVGWWVAWLVRRHWGRSPRLAHACPAPVAAAALSIAVCAAYAVLSGWGLPAQRTVWTMLGLALLRASGRDWPWTLSSLWVMAAVALIDPWALLQAGFWLSFLCVVVLMTMGDVGKPVPEVPASGTGWAGWWASAWRAVWAAVCALTRVQVLLSVAMAPVAVVCFHQVSLAGVLVNLLAIPLFDLCVTPLALLGMACPPLWRLDAVVLEVFMQALRQVANWSWAVGAWAEPPAWLGFWGVLAGLLWVWPGPRGWRWGWGLALLPLLALPPSWHLLPLPVAGQFQTLAIDIGQGTAVLVRTRQHALLFDTGPKMGEDMDAGARHILPALQTLGVRKLDVMMISHEDSDHVGGALSVLAGLPVTQLVSSLAPEHPVRTWPSWRAPGSLQPLPHAACQQGLSWDWDGVHFEVLHPMRAGEHANEPNAHSCVLRVSSAMGLARPARSLLLTADIEAPQEAALVAQAEHDPALRTALHSTVLMAPHHGSDTSSTSAFLQAVQPAQIVVQAGQRNRYGHPSAAVISRYDTMGLAWVATPTCGAWWWASDEADAPRASASRATPSVPGAIPSLGHCWRAAHPHHWNNSPEPPLG